MNKKHHSTTSISLDRFSQLRLLDQGRISFIPSDSSIRRGTTCGAFHTIEGLLLDLFFDSLARALPLKRSDVLTGLTVRMFLRLSSGVPRLMLSLLNFLSSLYPFLRCFSLNTIRSWASLADSRVFISRSSISSGSVASWACSSMVRLITPGDSPMMVLGWGACCRKDYLWEWR